MKKISIFTVLFAMLFVMNACQDYYFDKKMDYEFTLTSVKNIEYKLTDADYGTIAKDKEAITLAGDNIAALTAIGTEKQFSETIPAKKYLPIFIKNKFPEADNGSTFNVTYKEKGAEATAIFVLENGVWASNVYLNEPFAVGLGNFVIKDVTNESGSAIWAHSTQKGTYMKATAYINSVRYQTESWLISPAIDLTDAKAPVLSFDHTYQYDTTFAKSCNIYITDDYDGSTPDVTKWSKIDWLKDKDGNYIVPDGSNWTFISSGNFDIAKHAGKSNVFIAFRYTSTGVDKQTGTWEINNVIVQEAK